MAKSKLIEAQRQGAEIYHGDMICRSKIVEIFEEFSMPNGLLRVGEIDEFSFKKSTGFFWLKMKKKKEHMFKSIGRTVIYDVEITPFLEKGRVSKMTGVKGKEFMIPVAVTDMLVGAPTADMVMFTTAVGLSRALPISAFQLEHGGSGTK